MQRWTGLESCLRMRHRRSRPFERATGEPPRTSIARSVRRGRFPLTPKRTCTSLELLPAHPSPAALFKVRRRPGVLRAVPFLVSEHTVGVQDFERWLAAAPHAPAEMVLKNRLREMLEKK